MWTNGVVAVRIADTDSYPVAGATVTGEWAGSAKDIDTIITDGDSIATVPSDRTRDTRGTFTFTVTNVSKYGWTYAPDAKVEAKDTILY